MRKKSAQHTKNTSLEESKTDLKVALRLVAGSAPARACSRLWAVIPEVAQPSNVGTSLGFDQGTTGEGAKHVRQNGDGMVVEGAFLWMWNKREANETNTYTHVGWLERVP